MANNKNNFNLKPYKAQNMINRNRPKSQHLCEDPVGYMNIGVYTASGALPVPGALVTVYHVYESGEEHVLYQLITDENGIVPILEVPVVYEGPGQQTIYDYSAYNIRVEALGYYIVNLINTQIFPGITTNYRINLIPTMSKNLPDGAEIDYVIPDRPPH